MFIRIREKSLFVYSNIYRISELAWLLSLRKLTMTLSVVHWQGTVRLLLLISTAENDQRLRPLKSQSWFVVGSLRLQQILRSTRAISHKNLYFFVLCLLVIFTHSYGSSSYIFQSTQWVNRNFLFIFMFIYQTGTLSSTEIGNIISIHK